MIWSELKEGDVLVSVASGVSMTLHGNAQLKAGKLIWIELTFTDHLPISVTQSTLTTWYDVYRNGKKIHEHTGIVWRLRKPSLL